VQHRHDVDDLQGSCAKQQNAATCSQQSVQFCRQITSTHVHSRTCDHDHISQNFVRSVLDYRDMGLLLFALYAASHYGISAPILRSRQDQISSWHSEPNGRGTWGLLNSCVITMAICVWSAVHLNVPGSPPEDTWRPLSPKIWWYLSWKEKLERWKPLIHRLRRTRWTLMGLLAPELVVYCAWIQWSNARELSRSIARAKYQRKHP
jgi:hypothetical protein